jgi:hypothetical protein
MKRLFSVMLVAVLVASFVFGVMAADSQAKTHDCRYECQGIYWMRCCPPGQTSPDRGPSCTWTGYYCA